MTGLERSELAKLEARLFGLDGSAEGGAIGGIIDRLDHLEARVNRWAGALAVVGFCLGILAPKVIDVALHS